jgi:hypothetical protein
MISKDYYNIAGITFDTITGVKDGLVFVAKDYYQVATFKKDEFLRAVKRSGLKVSDIPRR